MRRRNLFIILIVAFALVVAACGDDDDSGTETTTTAASGGGEETTTTAASGGGEETTTAAPSGDVTTIGFWVAFSDEARLGFSQEKAAAFNAAHPEYNIEVTSFASYNDAFDAAVLAVDSGDPPGIIHFFEAATRQALDAVSQDGAPIFKSVTDALAGRTEILGEPVVLDDVVDAARNYYTVDGSFYSMPWNTSSTVMFSNQAMLDAAGIATPPATWAEVETACAAIMALPEAPSGCITWPNHSWFVEQSLGQVGELLANADNGRSGRATEVYLESQGMQDYINWWKGLDDNGYYPRHVKTSAELLAGAGVGHYVYVSSISAYASLEEPGLDESAPTAVLEDPTVETMGEQFQHYGGLKALCEEAAGPVGLPDRAALNEPQAEHFFLEARPRRSHLAVNHDDFALTA